MKVKSQKGKYGKVGAPPKSVKYPRNRFTVERAVEFNPNVCALTVRNRIKDDVKAGMLVELDPVRQPKGGVGRPKFTYCQKALAGNYAKPATVKPAKTVKAKKVKTPKTPASTPVVSVTTPDVTPAPAPMTPEVTPTPAVVAEAPAAEVVPATLP